MLQVIQNYNTGELLVDDVPAPTLQPGGILVRTMCSLISSGTERTTVETAQKSLLGKAQSRPDLVRKVIQVAKRDGLLSTFRLVQNKLDTPVALGYSSSGIVIAVADDVDEFAAGDSVACAGQGYASHAEIIFVPKNLAVRLPKSVTFDEGAYGTLGAIAMQGVRQAEVTVGDHVAVIGLGLLGLLTVQILKASGCRVIGFDLSKTACEAAKRLGAEEAFATDENFMPRFENATDGHGVDAAIITASAKTNEPVILAGNITRDKGCVVIVGAVPADIPRSPFYEKEIDIRFSRSYGPGRYDHTYEEMGLDYPYGYVRWTENRNIRSFLELVAHKQIDLNPFTTHRFTIEEAKKAYDLITGKSKTPDRIIGIILDYAHRNAVDETPAIHVTEHEPLSPVSSVVRIGFIGAGNFAQNFLLPPLKKNKRTRLMAVSTSKGVTAKNVAKKFKFTAALTDNEAVFENPDIDAVFITTRHHMHAQMVLKGIRAGKSIFVEKPLALNYEELQAITKAAEKPNRIMVGFNRRFAPTVIEAKKFLSRKIQPCNLVYRVNAGYVPKEHWTQDSIQGGGRIIGEVCHFVDLMNYLIGSIPVRVYADVLSSSRDDMMNKDNVSITFKYRDGSIGTIIYAASGDKSFPKERIELFNENSVLVIDDFRKVTFTRNGKTKSFGGSKQDKGYRNAIEAFITSIQTGTDSPIPLHESMNVTIATFKIHESLSKGGPVEIRLDDRHEAITSLGQLHTQSLNSDYTKLPHA